MSIFRQIAVIWGQSLPMKDKANETSLWNVLVRDSIL